MVDDKNLFLKYIERDYPLGKSSNLEENNEDIRLKVIKEKILEWFSKTCMDNSGNLFDSEGNILAKVNIKFLKYYSTVSKRKLLFF
jgi:hypothetical protein